jgi:hypothetical protein
MRTFLLIRTVDSTGVSGVGTVAEGVEFRDGHIAMRWIVGTAVSTSLWDSMQDLVTVHGHAGDTAIHWTTGQERI